MIYKKRGGWFYRDLEGNQLKFKNEADAIAAAGQKLDINRFKLPEPELLTGGFSADYYEDKLIGDDDSGVQQEGNTKED